MTKPVWVGLALKDYVCLPAAQKFATDQFCSNVTYAEFDTDHWVQLAAPDKLNNELLKWFKTLQVSVFNSQAITVTNSLYVIINSPQ